MSGPVTVKPQFLGNRVSCLITAEILQTRDDGSAQPPPSLTCSSRRKPEAAESSHNNLDNSQKKFEMINGVFSAGVTKTESKVLSKQPGQSRERVHLASLVTLSKAQTSSWLCFFPGNSHE